MRCPARFLLPGIGLGLVLAFLAAWGGTATAQAMPYQVTITGVEDSALAGRLNEVSTLIARKDSPPPSPSALRSRVKEDVERFYTALDSWGYFDATVEPRVDEAAAPVSITMAVTPGPAYRLTGFTLRPDKHAVGGPLPARLGDLAALGVVLDRPYRAETILEARKRIESVLQRAGHPFGTITGQKVLADHATHTVQAEMTIDPGPAARFGPVKIEGLVDVDAAYVRRRLAWKPGATWDSGKIEETRTALLESGLFSSARFDHADKPGPEGALAVTITVKERAHRSVGAGLRYSTSEGAGTRAYWEHRNLFGEGERLRLNADVATIKLGLSANYRQPDFLSPRQALLLGSEFARDDTNAYRTRRASLNGAIERRLSERLRGTLGLSADRISSDQSGVTRTYTLVGAPATLKYDASNSLLDPTEGFRVDLSATPYSRLIGSDLSFNVLRLGGSAYLRLDKAARAVLAFRAGAGSILGVSRDATPPDHRFYAGGSGTVRGFPYQKAGPLDASGDPVGGLSIVSAGIELRYRVTDSFGIVPFVDAATVSDSRFPSLNKSVFVGAGLGVRYYTGFGPIRVDVGVPVTNRREVSAPFQIYASIGQAF